MDTLSMSDGWMVQCTTFVPSVPRAVAVFVPDPGIDPNVYVPLGVAAARKGVLFVLPQWRDEGPPAGRHIQDLLELAAAARKEFPVLPLLLGGHSIGCSLLLRTLRVSEEAASAVFFLAPRWIGHVRYARACSLLERLQGITRALRDSGRARSHRCPDVDGALQSLRLPLFAAIPGQDEVVSGPAIANGLRKHGPLGSDRTIVTVPGAGHGDVVVPAAPILARWLSEVVLSSPGLHPGSSALARLQEHAGPR